MNAEVRNIMKLKVTLVRSIIGSNQKQIATVKGLGLRRLNQSRVLSNTPAIRGMIKKIIHLVQVEEITEA